MSETILIKDEAAGFAYSTYQKIIKIEMRELRDGWHIHERSGTKGGTLRDSLRASGLSLSEAETMRSDRIAAAIKGGFSIQSKG